MKNNQFTARPFTLPDQVWADIEPVLARQAAYKKKWAKIEKTRKARGATLSSSLQQQKEQEKAAISLTHIVHKYGRDMGDFTLIKDWQQMLRKRSNWLGNTISLANIADYYNHSKSGGQRYVQTILQDQDGAPQGFIKLSHKTLDPTPKNIAKGQSRRKDCTSIEETLVCDLTHLKDLSLFKSIYGFALEDCARMDHARVVTELGVGFSPQKYNGLARAIAKFSKEEQTPETQEKLEKLRTRFEKDWVAVTRAFVEEIGFDISDVAIPLNNGADATPQFRICKTLPGAKALPLYAYQGRARECYPLAQDPKLERLKNAINEWKSRAAQKYGLDLKSRLIAASPATPQSGNHPAL